MFRSLQEHFRQENLLREQREAAIGVSGIDDQDFVYKKALNDAWNAEVAITREIRLKKENAEREEYILSRLDAKKERDDKARQRTDDLVRKEMVCTESLVAAMCVCEREFELMQLNQFTGGIENIHLPGKSRRSH